MIGAIAQKQLDNIATWMIPIKQTNLPTVLRGIFHMDGNPLPDECITFYNLEWDTQTRSLVIPVFGPVQWTFHNSIFGWILLRSAELSQFKYKIQFDDETLQQAQIIPFAFGLPIPKWIVALTLSQDKDSSNGDTWQRKNFWFGGISRAGEYTLRRIVDENGRHTPAFNNMLTTSPNECLVITRDEKI
ncbi:hypothetical protein F7734_18940 [Scytonema sp. UIC 10036]|uniref:hypothetical protein n=1 Tax=Scytonema sp. UIC 10036 TaxID=2304196 RepID=UPI0012DA1DF7|nr:hypothetical protein [Scytonema sp. UIC 10036]MUG94339.1 hypothetical protein [Scytonema sp. UIC 10036]